jgi:hypothetical protein
VVPEPPKGKSKRKDANKDSADAAAPAPGASRDGLHSKGVEAVEVRRRQKSSEGNASPPRNPSAADLPRGGNAPPSAKQPANGKSDRRGSSSEKPSADEAPAKKTDSDGKSPADEKRDGKAPSGAKPLTDEKPSRRSSRAEQRGSEKPVSHEQLPADDKPAADKNPPTETLHGRQHKRAHSIKVHPPGEPAAPPADEKTRSKTSSREKPRDEQVPTDYKPAVDEKPPTEALHGRQRKGAHSIRAPPADEKPSDRTHQHADPPGGARRPRRSRTVTAAPPQDAQGGQEHSDGKSLADQGLGQETELGKPATAEGPARDRASSPADNSPNPATEAPEDKKKTGNPGDKVSDETGSGPGAKFRSLFHADGPLVRLRRTSSVVLSTDSGQLRSSHAHAAYRRTVYLADEKECLWKVTEEHPAVPVDRYGWEVNPRVIVTRHEREILEHESLKEQERELKWNQMMGPPCDPRTGIGTDTFYRFRRSHPDIVERRILKGIPDSCRSRAWHLMVDPKCEISGKRRSVDHYYVKGVPESDHVIQVDIPRTMPRVPMFAKNDARERLYRVLRAYSNADPELGYFQGMAFWAAMLLTYMTEEDAFWSFWQIMRGKHKLRNFFLDSFQNLRLINKVWDTILATLYPKFWENLTRLEIDHMLYTPGWFLTGFQTMDIPTPFKLRVFDRILGFGTRALLSFGITIVSIGKAKITAGSMEAILDHLQNPNQHPRFADWRAVIKKWDQKFLTQAQYSLYFKKAQIVEFR